MTSAAVWASDDESLRRAYRVAADRFEADFRRSVPYAWEQVGPWVYQGKPEGDLSLGWTKPRNFPLLTLPRWFLASVGKPVGADFVADLDYSSINGYHYVRLIDEVMDGELQCHPRVVAVTAFLHARFQGTLVRHFDAGSAFWPFFQRAWDEHVEITLRDAFLEEIDELEFREITGRKFVAAEIPLAAAAHHVGAVDRLGPWLAAVAPLGRWQQMLNDLFDWHYDGEYGTRTWIHSEAERRVARGEPKDAWFAREGFAWGRSVVDRLHGEVVAATAGLGSAPLTEFLDRRKVEVDADLDDAAEGVRALVALASALG